MNIDEQVGKIRNALIAGEKGGDVEAQRAIMVLAAFELLGDFLKDVRRIADAAEILASEPKS